MMEEIVRKILLVVSVGFGVACFFKTIELIGMIDQQGFGGRALDGALPVLYFLACTAVCLGIGGILQVLERIEEKLDGKDDSRRRSTKRTSREPNSKKERRFEKKKERRFEKKIDKKDGSSNIADIRPAAQADSGDDSQL